MLTSPWFVSVTSVVAWTCVVASAARHQRHWSRRLAVAVAVAVVPVVAVAAAIEAFDVLHYRFPPSFYVWLGLPVVAASIAVIGRPGASRRQESIAVVSVPAAVLFALVVVNAHYGYAPSVAALLGRNARDTVPVTRLAALRRAAAATGRVPERGAVVRVAIPPSTSGFGARTASVYLPPRWFTGANPHLPAVMLLSGTPGSPVDWTRSAFADVTADAYAAGHDGWAPVLVMPDALGGPFADTECVDGPRGNAETYLMDDVPGFMAARFGVPDERAAWVVAGSSAGGTCALTLALGHPDRVAGFADFSGDDGPNVGSRRHTVDALFDGSEAAYRAHHPGHLLASHRYDGTAAWFEVGTGDHRPLAAARDLAPRVAAAGADVCLVDRPGGHDFRFWASSFRHALPWAATVLGLTPGPVADQCRPPGHVVGP